MAKLLILSTTAVKSSLDVLLPRFELETGHQTVLTYVPSAQIAGRVKQSEPFDLAVATKDVIDELIADGRIQAGTDKVIAQSDIGFAVPANTPTPDISTTDAFKTALLNARSIATSNPVGGGQSGRHLVAIFEKLGITDALKGKMKYGAGGPAGLVGHFLVRGEADIGLQQLSELMSVPGINFVGRLPPDVQVSTLFSVGLSARAENPAGAQALVDVLTSRSATPVFEKNGMNCPKGS